LAQEKHLSLGAQLLILCFSIIVVLGGTVSIIFVNGMNHITRATITAQAESAMRSVNADILNVTSYFADVVETVSVSFTLLSDQATMLNILKEVAAKAQDREISTLYYATVIPRTEAGGV
jgi:Na+-translocating ferredoxin:NAD+ oxidoreductase RnfG subunit